MTEKLEEITNNTTKDLIPMSIITFFKISTGIVFELEKNRFANGFILHLSN